MVKQMVIYNKRNAAIRSYVDGVKKRMDIKINQEVIS
jgi:hypothetical protein